MHLNTSTMTVFADATADRDAACTFIVQFGLRLRRCGVTRAALRLLEHRAIETDSDAMHAMDRHLDWLKVLAVFEMRERATLSHTVLVLTESMVRFQLAADENELSNLPIV